MTREQHLEFCRRCTNRKFDAQQGVICGITNTVADFDPSCENFSLDEAVKIEKIEETQEAAIPNHILAAELSDKARTKLRTQQDIEYAVIGGASAAVVGAVLWALVTVVTNYQIGYMAIAVGALVGFAVRYFGAGIDKHYGFIGAFFALIGCALGNLLSQVAFIADAESLGYYETLTLLNFDIIGSIYADSFSPYDILFYGIAAYEGYKFAFRDITDDLIKSASVGKLEPLPYAKFRLPSVIVLIVLLAGGILLISRGTSGVRTFTYESGAKKSTGEMVAGKENGFWEYYWENGKIQYKGFFIDGVQDSTWEFFDEEGVRYRTGTFKAGMEHGAWSDYYPEGQASNTGSYKLGRLMGLWTYYYPNGKVSQTGTYYLDNPDGTWEFFTETGVKTSSMNYKHGEPLGEWKFWTPEGVMTQHLNYLEDGKSEIVNTWSEKGAAEVINGNGVFKRYHENDKLAETGTVKNKIRTGVWKRFTVDGDLAEEGEYRDGIYYMLNAWSPEKKQMIKDGEGKCEFISDDGASVESGVIVKGLREGKWTVTSTFDSAVTREVTFKAGKAEGQQTTYFEDGTPSMNGNFINDKREGEWSWYHPNGSVESSINYVAGKKDGPQYFYFEDGKLKRTEVYKKGELIEVKVGI
jgi:antitoxin component YwqK of YwqJK toxin-antitoxin module